MAEALIQLVDENDNPLRGGTMDEAQLQGLWHRIVRVMVHDVESDRWLLQKVAPNPYYNGGLWNTTSSGHVDEGEAYGEAGVRETEEEMGISGLTLLEFDRYKTETSKLSRGEQRVYRRHNVTYTADVKASEIVLNPSDEVDEVLGLSLDALRELRNQAKPPLTDGLIRFIDQL